MTTEDIADLRGILNEVYDAYVRDDMIAYGTTDRRFHETIARLSGNDTLIESLDRLAMQVQIVRMAANRDPDVVERAAHQRPAILAALEAGDAGRAAKLMETHIDDVRRSVVAQLEHEERTATEPEAQAVGTAPSSAPGAVGGINESRRD
jgi:DNA-binding GntR family transcriptional regulator